MLRNKEVKVLLNPWSFSKHGKNLTDEVRQFQFTQLGKKTSQLAWFLMNTIPLDHIYSLDGVLWMKDDI